MNRKMRILLGGMFLCLGLPFAAPAQDAAPFRVATVADGLEHPWSLAFLPDGRMLEVPHAAHLANAEQPDIITPALINHLEQP